jgi:hypothetical protein
MGTIRTATAHESATRRSARSRKRFPGPLAGLRSDAEYFESLKKKLLARPDFEDRYVAVLQRQMVGTDSDELALFKRVTAKYGDVPFYIGRVERRPRVKRMRSPRVFRRSS